MILMPQSEARHLDSRKSAFAQEQAGDETVDYVRQPAA
jgi:hypothetical protein